jgi:hypothetical protein
MPTPWSRFEIEATVAAYSDMLLLELARAPYVKSDHNERLQRGLDNRSKAAVEYKFQNISAVLVNHGQAYIRGYLPAQNYQRALESAVLEWLDGRADIVERIEQRAAPACDRAVHIRCPTRTSACPPVIAFPNIRR